MYLTMPHRATDPELLDQPDVSRSDLYLNLAELDSINRILGGHKTTIAGLRHFLKGANRPISVLDIGCGGGDTLLAVYQWGREENITFYLYGVDLLPDAIAYARETLQGVPRKKLWAQDFHQLPDVADQYDVVISSLFCHHLYGEELRALLRKMLTLSRLGILINDLHRHPLAYYSIRMLTALFSRSHLVRNDAALSVRKGFRRDEWEELLCELGWGAYNVEWQWAFRHLITVDKQLEEAAHAA
jgi:SAM-dependent methyltransferase